MFRETSSRPVEGVLTPDDPELQGDLAAKSMPCRRCREVSDLTVDKLDACGGHGFAGG